MDGEIKEIFDNYVKRRQLKQKRYEKYAKLQKRTPLKKTPGKISLLTIPTVREFNEELQMLKRQAGTIGKNKRGEIRKLSDTHKHHISRSLNAKWILIDPAGNEHIVDDLKSFSKKHGLSYKCMSAVNVGRLKTHQGWLCKKLDMYDANLKKLMKYGLKYKSKH